MKIREIGAYVGAGVIIGAVVLSLAFWGWSNGRHDRMQGEILDGLDRRQGQIADWMDVEIKRQRDRALYRQLCREGRIAEPEKNCPPDARPGMP